jgi:16S rRNA (cytosine967-C5)-methyltransferase
VTRPPVTRPAATQPAATQPTVRDLALETLVRVDNGARSNVLLPQLLRASPLSDQDRAFATSLVYGTLRRQRALDHLLALRLDRPLRELEPSVRAALRLGAFQLVDGVAPHAAVGETVDALGRVRHRARGFVNAVLRAVAALGPPWPWPSADTPRGLAIRTSHPDWLVERLQVDLGAVDARTTLEIANLPPVVTLRPNPLRTTPAELAAELRAAGTEVEPGTLVPDALLVRRVGDPQALEPVAAGRATPQDQASQAVVDSLDPRPGERILEVAAAPGGKATAIAERLGDDGLVAALDIDGARLRLARDAADRLGLECVAPVVADGRALPFRAAFDRVLVDAPCTGLGVLRRRAEARWRVGPGDPAALAALQRELLAAAAGLVRAEGRLVYSVCTLTREETLGVDAWADANLRGFVAEPPPGGPWRPWGRGALLLPAAAGTDGMFVLVLRHGSGPASPRLP